MIDFTPYLALDWLILALLLGFGWSVGCWLWATIAAALTRKPRQ